MTPKLPGFQHADFREVISKRVSQLAHSSRSWPPFDMGRVVRFEGAEKVRALALGWSISHCATCSRCPFLPTLLHRPHRLPA